MASAFSIFDGGLYPVGAPPPPAATVGYALLGLVGFSVGVEEESPPSPTVEASGGGSGGVPWHGSVFPPKKPREAVPDDDEEFLLLF